MPAFRRILNKARKEGVRLHNLSSHCWSVLSSYFDESEYDHVLDFMCVGPVNNEWYARCIKSFNLLMEVSEDVYLQLLFVADNWPTKFCNTATVRSGVLIPANGSKWVELIGYNTWSKKNYIELGEDYLHPACFAGTCKSGKQFMEFLSTHIKAADIPQISPPKAGIPTTSGPLTKQNAFLLLEWIRELQRKGISIPKKFLACIKEGSWLKIAINDSPGYRPPSESSLLASDGGNSNWGTILQTGTVFVDIPIIDQSFYGDKIKEYKEELKTTGFMCEYRIGKRAHLLEIICCMVPNGSRSVRLPSFLSTMTVTIFTGKALMKIKRS